MHALAALLIRTVRPYTHRLETTDSCSAGEHRRSERCAAQGAQGAGHRADDGLQGLRPLQAAQGAIEKPGCVDTNAKVMVRVHTSRRNEMLDLSDAGTEQLTLILTWNAAYPDANCFHSQPRGM